MHISEKLSEDTLSNPVETGTIDFKRMLYSYGVKAWVYN